MVDLVEKKRGGLALNVDLLQTLETSEITRANELLAEGIRKGSDPWEVHRALFPVVQRVLKHRILILTLLSFMCLMSRIIHLFFPPVS